MRGACRLRIHPPKGLQVPTAPIIRDQQPLSAFKMVATKNLFSQDRSDPTADIAKVQNSLEGFELLGVLILGDTRVAIIGGKPKGRSYRPGGSRGNLSGRELARA